MKNAGLELIEVKNPAEQVPADKVGYIFTQDDATTMFWTLRKKVAAGAMSNKSYVKEAKKRISKLQILKESKAFPRHVICLRLNFSAEVTAELQKVLFKMHTTDAGKAALKTFSKTAKFDLLPDESKKDMLETRGFIKNEFNIKWKYAQK